MKLTRMVLALLAIALPVGCSTIDSADKNELIAKIGALPPPAALTLKQVTAHHNSEIYLRKRKPGTKVGGAYCRRFNTNTSAWGDWLPQVDVTVADVLKCVVQNLEVYSVCGDLMILAAILQAHNVFETANIDASQFQCKYRWEQDWSPAEMPTNTDPDRVTAEDIIESMISMPSPPPGIVWGDSLAPLVPLLCPLTTWEQAPCAPSPGGGDK